MLTTHCQADIFGAILQQNHRGHSVIICARILTETCLIPKPVIFSTLGWKKNLRRGKITIPRENQGMKGF